MVFDPFMGSGSTGAAAILEDRNFTGIELDTKYFEISKERLTLAKKGLLRYRDIETPVFDPAKAGSVAKDPIKFKPTQEPSL